MNARVFISYRTADGMDKATALARDLGARFGDDQVFLDKDDLRGGSSWRAEVGRALGARPVLLLLLTPQVFAATDATGRRRIEDPGDPVRREFETALEAGADVIPVCCDGVDAPPHGLAPPFDRLGEYTWRRLRAYDWKHDVERLASDLGALGIRQVGRTAPSGADTASAAQAATASPHASTGSSTSPARDGRGAETPPASDRRRGWLGALGLGGIAVLGLGAWLATRVPTPSATQDGAASAPASVARPGLPGTWIATVAAEPPFALTLQQNEQRVALTSEPMPVAGRPGWQAYRDFWLRLTGTELRDVVYRGQGTVITDAFAPLTIDIAWIIFNGAGDTKIDSGNLHAVAAPDGASLTGTLWSNGDQAAKPIVLKRPR